MAEHPDPGPTLYRADYLYTAGALQPGGVLAVDAAGRVAERPQSAEAPQDFGHALIVPGLVNTHSHAFQVLLRGRGEQARSFRDWVDRHLYALVERMSPELVYRSAVLAFAEMLLEGVTSVGEFFYLNRLPGAGPHGGARAVLQAAEAVGIRLCLLRSLYDRRRRSAQERFCEPPEEALASARDLQAEVRERGHGFGVAPHSLHGASAEMIRRGFELGVELDCPVHIHLAEQRSDLEGSRELYGTSPLRALEGLGVLDRRLTCVHGVWLDAEEIELMGRRGVSLAYNPRSNMALGDGIAPLREMLHAGVRVSLGIDGPGANNQAGILHEVRAAEALQRVRSLEMNQLPGIAGGRPDPRVLLEMATANGAKNLGLAAGELLPGEWADFLVVDLEDPSLWPWSEDEPQTLVWNFLLSAAPRACIRHVYVGGRPVVQDGRLAGIGDLDKEIGGRRLLARQAAGPA
jgi:5-methylthioadenosine/S-adenosylhomocysteine deaminase